VGTLVGAGEAARVAAIARAIPDVGDTFGFEYGLRTGKTSVDLGICLRRRVRRERGPALRWIDDRWARLGELLATWSDRASTLHAWVPFLFLEFDAVGCRAAVPIPSVFVTLDEPLGGSATTMVRGFAIARQALRLLHGRALAPAVRAQLGACFRRLPPAGRVVHVGAMLARTPATIRLSVAMPRTDAEGYLASIGWATPASDLKQVYATYSEDTREVHLEFDVASRVGPKLGVVFAPRDEIGWRSLLEALVARGLCAPAKRDALLSWPGEVESTIAGRRWIVLRTLSHVKISHARGAELEAKAYVTGSPCRPA